MSSISLPTKLTWGADCPATQVAWLPRSIPAIWPYITGTPDIKWSPVEIAWFHRAKVFHVNQHFDNDDPYLGDEFDVEELAWTPAQVVEVVRARRERQWSTRLYGTYATYGQTVTELANAGVRRSTFWRIADWNLDAHMADATLWGDVYAGQWASPTSNPHTLIPGSDNELWVANVDLNVLLTENTGWQG